MANKTIYVKDERLWRRARELAGKDGLSSVIQRALERFVETAELATDGFTPHRLGVEFRSDPLSGDVDTTERIAFDGRLLVTRETVAGSTPKHEEENAHDVIVAVYQTKGNKLILTMDEAGGDGITYYKVYDTLTALRDDPELRRVGPVERAQFLETVSEQLGEDWAIWID